MARKTDDLGGEMMAVESTGGGFALAVFSTTVSSSMGLVAVIQSAPSWVPLACAVMALVPGVLGYLLKREAARSEALKAELDAKDVAWKHMDADRRWAAEADERERTARESARFDAALEKVLAHEVDTASTEPVRYHEKGSKHD